MLIDILVPIVMYLILLSGMFLGSWLDNILGVIVFWIFFILSTYFIFNMYRILSEYFIVSFANNETNRKYIEEQLGKHEDIKFVNSSE